MIAADSAESGPGATDGGAAQRGDLALGDFAEQGGDEIGLAGEIAIDRARRDAGAPRDRRDLHRRHAAFARRRARRGDDRRMPGGKPARDIFGAAIGHRWFAKRESQMTLRNN